MQFLHYSNVSDLWADLIGAFPDAGDVVQPKTIRQEAIDTLSAAVDSEAYRRFPQLDVENYEQREALVAQMREQIVTDLLPEVSHVTGTEARELSYSSVDQYGRSAEDSRYLASYALNAEWECRRILGAQEETSFDQFVQNAAPDMRDAIDMAFRRNLGAFNEIVRQVSYRDPLNTEPIAPNLVITPVQNQTDYVIPGEVVGEVNDEIADWFTRNRQYIANNPDPVTAPPAPGYQPTVQYGQNGLPDQGYQQYPPQHQQGQQWQGQQQPQEESFFNQMVRKGIGKAKDYLEDPDGVHEARRRANRLQREQEATQRQLQADANLRRELDKELLISRRKRNRRW